MEVNSDQKNHTNKKYNVFSGVQPTGEIHIGNYIGAISNFSKLQNTNNSSINQSFFCIADLHSQTNIHQIYNIKDNIISTIKWHMVSGVDPKNLFIQSTVKQHLELYWILSLFCQTGWLDRMTQFKDKGYGNLGLYSYPVLMAADVLLYKANKVPVGKDQKQHIELIKSIIVSFNKFINDAKLNTMKLKFEIPEPIMSDVSKIMSLSNPEKKMSKSCNNSNSAIFMKDSKDDISRKIKKAVTGERFEWQVYPGLDNLVNIYCHVLNKTHEYVFNTFHNTGSFKKELSDVLINWICDLQYKYNNILDSDINIVYDNHLIKDTAKNNLEEIICILNLKI